MNRPEIPMTVEIQEVGAIGNPSGYCLVNRAVDPQYWREPNYKRLASEFDRWYRLINSSDTSLHNLDNKANAGWAITEFMRNTAPSGSGIDCGTKFDFTRSKPNRLVLTLSYHQMDQNGMYAGWTEHQVIVTPSLQFGFELRITGRDRNQVKEYLYQTYQYWLSEATYTNKQWYELFS